MLYVNDDARYFHGTKKSRETEFFVLALRERSESKSALF